MKNTPYTHCQDVNGEALHWLWPAMREMEGCLEMMTDTVSGLKFNKERALETARGNFCTAAELANTLVRHDHISFRTAHEIVAEVVNRMIAGNLKADETGLAVIAPVFREVVGRETTLTEDDVRSGLDPERTACSGSRWRKQSSSAKSGLRSGRGPGDSGSREINGSAVRLLNPLIAREPRAEAPYIFYLQQMLRRS